MDSIEADALKRFASEQGWTPATQITVLLRYISEEVINPEAFEDFLQDIADEENDTEESSDD